MPYTIRKRKCKQSDGDSGSYVLSYKDKKGKKHRACHTSRKKARGQIAAIEAEGVERNETMKISLSEIRSLIKQILSEAAFVSSMDTALKSSGGIKGTLERINASNSQETLAALVQNMLSNLSSSNILSPDLITLRGDLESIKTYLQSDSEDVNDVKQRLNVNDVKQRLIGMLTSLDPESEREQEEEKMQSYIAGYKKPTVAKPGSEDVSKYLAGFGKQKNESFRSLKALIREFILEEKKSKADKKDDKSSKGEDMDADGDIDAADYKTKVYMAGGVPKGKALKMSRKFDGK